MVCVFCLGVSQAAGSKEGAHPGCCYHMIASRVVRVWLLTVLQMASAWAPNPETSFPSATSALSDSISAVAALSALPNAWEIAGLKGWCSG